MTEKEAEWVSEVVYERDFFRKILEELNENPLKALGYTEQDEVPDDVISNIKTWACLMLYGAGFEATKRIVEERERRRRNERAGKTRVEQEV